MSIPVSMDATYRVHKMAKDGDFAVESTLMPSFNPASWESAAPFVLHFETGPIPPLGAVVFRVEKASDEPSVVREEEGFGSCPTEGVWNVRVVSKDPSSSAVVIDNGRKRFVFDRYVVMLRHPLVCNWKAASPAYLH